MKAEFGSFQPGVVVLLLPYLPALLTIQEEIMMKLFSNPLLARTGYLTPREATAIWPGLSYWRLIRWIQRRQLDSIRINKRQRVIHRDDLESVLAERAPHLLKRND